MTLTLLTIFNIKKTFNFFGKTVISADRPEHGGGGIIIYAKDRIKCERK